MKSSHAVFAFLCCAGGVACTTSADPSASSAQAAALAEPGRAEQACGRVEGALGRRRYRCLFPAGVTPLPISSGQKARCESLAAAVEADRLVVDAAHLDACIAEIDSASCENDPAWTFAPAGPCARVFVHSAEDASCTTDLECGGGRYCHAPNTFCAGECRPRPNLGEPCGHGDGGFACAYGLACSAVAAGLPACALPIPFPPFPVTLLGGRCGADHPDCEAVARCVADRCERRVDLGEACAGPDDCLDGFCDAARCAPFRREGEACSMSWQCVEDLACSAGTCRAVCR